MRRITFALLLFLSGSLSVGLGQEPSVRISQKAEFLHAQFGDLLPAVLRDHFVCVTIKPARKVNEFERLSLASSEIAHGRILDEADLATYDFLRSRELPSSFQLGTLLNSVAQKQTRVLSIPFSDFSYDEFLKSIDSLQWLGVLEAGGSRLGVEELRLIAASCPHLFAIDLSDTEISAHDLLSVCGLRRRLRGVSLGGVNGTAMEFKSLLRYWPKVEKLYLHDTAINDDVCHEIAKLRGLRVLDISGTKVSESGLAAILTNKSLEELYARRMCLSISEEACRGALPKLRILSTDAMSTVTGSVSELSH